MHYFFCIIKYHRIYNVGFLFLRTQVIADHIGGVMVSVLDSIEVYRGFEPRSVKPKTEIDICCFSAKHTVLRRKSKD